MNRRTFPLSRRRFLVSSLSLATISQIQRAAAASGFMADAEICRLTAEQEEGPFYVADEALRSDIAEDKPGVPLLLRILVLDARTCKPLPHAAVDLWHCDALGVYSGFREQSERGGGPGGPPPGEPDGPPPDGPPPDFDSQGPGERRGPPPGHRGPHPENHPTDKLTFLRGLQLSGEDGAVTFRTVFPGFYMGRTNHVHFKVRVGGRESARSYAAGHTSHTGQIFFPEKITTELMQHEPYCRHTIHRTTQGADQVFADQHGELSIARVQWMRAGSFLDGMHAELVASVDPTATPPEAQRRGGGGGPDDGHRM